MSRQRLHCGLICAILATLSCIVSTRDAWAENPPVGSFLERHWARPLKAQGDPPSSFSALEASLDPAACGQCHVAQFADWKSSFHARAMGPGVLGQLLDMAADADQHQACLRCHAPLAEQATNLMEAALGRRRDGLHEAGLVCAGCHVREHVRYGPPRRGGAPPGPTERLPHGGWRASEAFSDSRFCAACHQFEPEGFALNGKLLENTYEEWRVSRYVREGRTCQGCHMPGRRHLWRGIHDPEMVRAGVSIETQPPRLARGRLAAGLRLANTGAGHAFPTYVTPSVGIEIFQADHQARPLPGTRRAHRVARQVTLDLSREISDTRLAPDEAVELAYERPLHAGAALLIYRVRVEPDAFYADFYRDTLRRGSTRAGQALIRRALAVASASGYVLFERRAPLTTLQERKGTRR